MALKIEGHLTSKSSPLAPVSCKLTKQFIVQQHLNAHYKNISKVKSSIDNKCPKSWYKNVTVKDQLRKERLIKSAREHVRERNSPNIFQNKTFRSENEDDTTLTNNRMSYEELKPIGPRIYKKDVKSKIAQLRCYNPPKIKNTTKSSSTTCMMSAPVQENLQETSPPVKNEILRNEVEDLRYLNFCNDVTNDILTNNVFTDRGIYQIFDYHIKKNVYNLKMDKMLIAYDDIRKELQASQVYSKFNPETYAGKNMTGEFTTKYPMSEYRENREDFNYETSEPIEYLKMTKENYPNLDETERCYGSKEYKHENNDYDYNLQYSKIIGEIDNNFERNTSTEKYFEKNNFKDNSTGDHSFSEIYRKLSDDNEDSKYLSRKKEENFLENDYINPKNKRNEFSAAPSALQWSLTSNEDYDLHSKFNNQKPNGEPSIIEICEKVDNVQLNESVSEPIERNALKECERNTPEIENSNISKNVHFANQNEIYSVAESDEPSLTDVTSMRLEENEDSDEDNNNDSTCAESSLDLNNTFKSDGAKDNTDVIRYEDDFDD